MYKENELFQLEAFSQRLKKLRTETGYTQKEIASEIGLSRTQYLNIEKGDYHMSLDKLALFIEAVRKRNFAYGDINFLVMGDKLGSWKQVDANKVAPQAPVVTCPNNNYVESLRKEIEELKRDKENLNDFVDLLKKQK